MRKDVYIQQIIEYLEHVKEKDTKEKDLEISKRFEEYMGSSGSSFKGHSGYKKADGTYMINATRNKRNVWTITTKPFKDAHFATFPKDLIEPCIKAGCPEGGVVLDPFGGSGTTGIVAALNNRNAILIELNQNYIDIANKRID